MSKKDLTSKYPLTHSEIINVNGKRYRTFSTEEQKRDVHPVVDLEPALKKLKVDGSEDSGVERSKFFVGNQYLGKVIGSRGSTKSRIERETNCKIVVPPRGVFSHYVEIQGLNHESVEKCKERIRQVIPRFPQKTHFLSIKIRKCRSIFENFQKKLLQEFGKEIHPRMFINPYRLHLTLQVLSITSEEMLEHTKRILDTKIKPFIEKEFADPNECYLQYFSLGTFPERSPRYAKVLHFQPTHTESIQKLIDHINKVFVEENILEEEFNVTLHSTVLNTKYMGGGNRGGGRWKKFDAQDILKKYGDLKESGFEGKKLQFKTLQLNVLGGGEGNKSDKYYTNDHKIFFFK